MFPIICYIFRNNLHPNLSLGELQGHVVEFAEDQHGSRFIQQNLVNSAEGEIETIFKVTSVCMINHESGPVLLQMKTIQSHNQITKNICKCKCKA